MQTLCLPALKVYRTPENERNSAGYGGGGGRGIKSPVTVSLRPHPSQSVGYSPPPPPAGAPHSRWKEQGAARGGRREDSQWGVRVQPYRERRGRPVTSTPGPRPPAPPLFPSCPGGPGPLSPPPQRVAGGGSAWPGPLGADGLFLSGVQARAAGSPSACAPRVRASSPPQPRPPGGAKWVLKAGPAAASWAVGLGASAPPLPGSQCPSLGVGWCLGKFSLSSSRPIRHPLAAGSPHCPTRPFAWGLAPSLPWGRARSGPRSKLRLWRDKRSFPLPLRIRSKVPAGRGRETRPPGCAHRGTASAAAAAPLQQVVRGVGSGGPWKPRF